MPTQDSTFGFSVAQNDLSDTEHLWRRAFKEIQPLLSTLAAQSGNTPLAKAYAQAVKQSQGHPESWAKTGWRKTLSHVLGKYIELTRIGFWDWTAVLHRPEKVKPLQAVAWSCQVNPEETLHLVWIKDTALVAITDDLSLLEGAIQHHIRLTMPPNQNSTLPLSLKAWIWDKHNFVAPCDSPR